MTLSEPEIKQRLDDGSLVITRDEGAVSIEPSSVDLHLADELLAPRTADLACVDVTDGVTFPRVESVPSMTVPPQSFRLAATQEYVGLPDDLVGFLWGRSSVGRLGMFVHNAGLVDSGFEGDLTLELFNAAPYPIDLQAGMRIVQLSIHEHETPPTTPYGAARGSKYNGQQGATPSRLSADFD